jgi:hypothetical protein
VGRRIISKDFWNGNSPARKKSPHPQPPRAAEKGAKLYWVSQNRTFSSLHSAILDADAHPHLQVGIVRNADAVTWVIGREEG